MIWVVVAMDVLQDFWRHSKESSGFPYRHAAPHQPARSRMAQGVWSDLTGQTGKTYSSPEALLHRGHRLAVELDKAVGDELTVPPTTQVSEQPRRYRCRRLAHPVGPFSITGRRSAKAASNTAISSPTG
jgi:hypothetical protein